MLELVRPGLRLLSTLVAMFFAAAVVVADSPSASGQVAASTSAAPAAELVRLYLPIHQALVADSAAPVKQAAAALAEAAESVAIASKDAAPWTAVATAAKAMTGDDLAALRAQLKPLSAALGKLLEKEAVAGHGLYYCPMADAYWIQKSGDVANPYYGKSMLRCGEAVAKVEE